MKRVILLSLLVAIFKFSAFAQDDYYEPQNRQYPIPHSSFKKEFHRNWNIKTKTDSLEFEMAYMRYCLGKFHRNFMTGVAMEAIGTAIYVGGAINFSSEGRNSSLVGGALVTGGGLIIAGVITQLLSYRWIKIASLKPTQYGIGVSINLHKR